MIKTMVRLYGANDEEIFIRIEQGVKPSIAKEDNKYKRFLESLFPYKTGYNKLVSYINCFIKF